MTIFNSSNFDAASLGAIAPGWVANAGTWTVSTVKPVSGTQAFGANGDGDSATYTGAAAAVDMGMQYDFIIGSGGRGFGAGVRFDAAYNNGYLFLVYAFENTIRCLRFKKVGGTFSAIGEGLNTGISAPDGTVVHVRATAIGSNISAYVSIGSNPLPTTPTATFTDTSVTAAGYPLLYRVTNSQSAEAGTIDNFQYDDNAVSAPADPDAHKFWRVLVTAKNGTQPGVFIGDVEFRTQADASNYFTPYDATDVAGIRAFESSHYAGFSAEKAFNNSSKVGNLADGATRWISSFSDALPQFVGCELPTAVNVKQLALFASSDDNSCAENMPMDFALQYADAEAGPWTTKQAWTNKTDYAAGQGRTFEVSGIPIPTASPPAGAFRYMQISIAANNGDGYMSMAELEFRESAGGADVTNPDTPIMASSYLIAADERPSKMLDNNYDGHGWTAGTHSPVQFPQTITVDFGSPKTIREIYAKVASGFHSRGMKNFVVRGSNTGMFATDFEDIKTFTDVGINTGWTSPQLLALPVTAVAPTVAAPSINGTPQVGTATSYTAGAVTGSPAPTITQQWTLDGVDISGATAATYIPVTGNDTKALRVRQIVTNGSGTANATSAPKTVIAAPTTDTVPPTLLSATLNAAGTRIDLLFNEAFGSGTPDASTFALSLGRSVGLAAKDGQVSGGFFLSNITPAYNGTDTVTTSYTKPATGGLRDAAGNEVASFGPVTVTNNSTVSPPTSRNLTMTNALYAAGVFGQALSGGYGTVNPSPIPTDRTKDYYISFRFKRNNQNLTNRNVIFSQPGVATLWLDNTGNPQYTVNGTTTASNAWASIDNIFHYCYFVFIGNRVELWMDGQGIWGFNFDKLNSSGYNPTTSALTIGAEAGGVNPFGGTIDMFTVALGTPGKEVPSEPMNPKQPGLLALYTFDGNGLDSAGSAGTYPNGELVTNDLQGQRYVLGGNTFNGVTNGKVYIYPANPANGAEAQMVDMVVSGTTWSAVLDDIVPGDYANKKMSFYDDAGNGVSLTDAGFSIMGISGGGDLANSNAGTVLAPTTLILTGAGSASINVAVPMTVTTDNPLTGAETKTVVLTSPNGAFAPGQVTLSAQTVSVEVQYTATVPGSHVLTASSSGSPTLANATKQFSAADVAVAQPPTVTITTSPTGILKGDKAEFSGSCNFQGDADGVLNLWTLPQVNGQDSGSPIGPVSVSVVNGQFTVQRPATVGKVKYRVTASANDFNVSATTAEVETLTLVGNALLPV